MLQDPLSVNVGTNTEPTEIQVPRINQDGYSAEYGRNDEGVVSEVDIRHSTEARAVNGRKLNRHYVGLTITTPSQVDGMPPETVNAYMIIRGSSTAAPADIQKCVRGVSNLVETNFQRLLARES